MLMPCHGDDDVAVAHEIVTGAPFGRLPLSVPSPRWREVGLFMPPAIPYWSGLGKVAHTPMPGWPSIGMTCSLSSPAKRESPKKRVVSLKEPQLRCSRRGAGFLNPRGGI